MPGIGSPRYAEIPLVRGVRMLAIKDFENYLLFYLERENSVDVIRVLHETREIPEALQSRGGSFFDDIQIRILPIELLNEIC
jgi:toxin ParE1/3/4